MAAIHVLAEMGEHLRRQRKKMKITQEETAELSEMSTTFYGEIERGNKRLVEVFMDCPTEKVHILEQILVYLKMLCK